LTEEGWLGELALLSHYNGHHDDIRTWDEDRIMWSLGQMQLAMKMLKLRE
jgi:hypothetical protein